MLIYILYNCYDALKNQQHFVLKTLPREKYHFIEENIMTTYLHEMHMNQVIEHVREK